MRAGDVDARDLDEQREVGEGRPEGGRLGRDVGVRVEQRVAEGRLVAGRQLALDLAAGGRRRRTGRTRRTGAGSRPCRPGSNSIAWFGRGRRNRKRSCSGGTTSAIVCAAAPRPFEVDIFLPPMLRNSYGTLSGGSRSNTSRAIASLRSREPPAVARSLPQASMVTPKSDHWAAQSRFQGSLAAPPNGEIRPDAPQPRAHSTRSGRHS